MIIPLNELKAIPVLWEMDDDNIVTHVRGLDNRIYEFRHSAWGKPQRTFIDLVTREDVDPDSVRVLPNFTLYNVQNALYAIGDNQRENILYDSEGKYTDYRDFEVDLW